MLFCFLFVAHQTRSDFFELLSEHTLDAKSQWRKVRSKIEKDSRYKAIDNVGVREELFKEYMEQLLKVCASEAGLKAIGNLIFTVLV